VLQQTRRHIASKLTELAVLAAARVVADAITGVHAGVGAGLDAAVRGQGLGVVDDGIHAAAISAVGAGHAGGDLTEEHGASS
jgi:hypothetical protein